MAKDILTQFEDLKTKYSDAIILFRIGDFYEAIKEDAEKMADILGIVLQTKGSIREGGYYISGFPHHSLDSFLPKLIRKGHKVIICEKV